MIMSFLHFVNQNLTNAYIYGIINVHYSFTVYAYIEFYFKSCFIFNWQNRLWIATKRNGININRRRNDNLFPNLLFP